MYDNWLKPAPEILGNLPAHAFGNRLQDNPRRSPVALIGIDEGVANEVRQQLYTYAWDFDDLAVADLGNLRKASTEFAIPLLRELYTSGITPILIGGSQHFFKSQYLAFNEINRQVSLCAVDSQVELNLGTGNAKVLDRAVIDKGRKSFHLSHIGSQRHLVDPDIWKIFDLNHYESISLGLARRDGLELEPPIRDADLLGFNIRAINHYDAPARADVQPSGFNLQEGSQIAYYAGNSDKLSSFGLYGLNMNDVDTTRINLTAGCYAQLIWYFIQGFSRRAGDYPLSTTGMHEYIVDMDSATRLFFWKSPHSNRWWCELPRDKFKGDERHRFIPCSFQDYLTASKEQTLPDRLLIAELRYT